MRTLTLIFALLFAVGCGSSIGALLSNQVLLFATFQPMTYQLGQPSFTSGTANQGNANPSATSLRFPGAGMAGGTNFYVPDAGNNRVLGYTSVPNVSMRAADFPIGQATLATAATGTSSGAMNNPLALWATSSHLFVSDTGNNRVLIFAGAPVSSGSTASFVLGQTGFGLNGTGGTATTMDSPVGICSANGKLLVCDRDNNRVLIWNSIPSANGVAADLVLGQANLSSVLPNRGATPAANTLNWPWGVWTDGTIVAVADAANHRVLIWNSFPTTNGQPADVVLGQAGFTTSGAGLTATSFNVPTDVTSNGIQLFVGDCENNRVLLWDTFPTVNQAAPNKVLGQGDFTHGRQNDDDQNTVDDGQPSQRTLNSAGGFLFVRLDQSNLFVGDHRNHRVGIWRGN